MCEAIGEAVRRTDSHHEIRCVVLSGAGEVFCSGADLAAVSGPQGTDFIRPFETMLEVVARCRVPVIAAIQGAALGGGLRLATACDGSKGRSGRPAGETPPGIRGPLALNCLPWFPHTGNQSRQFGFSGRSVRARKRTPTLEAIFRRVPVGHLGLTQSPAEKGALPFDLGREVDQPGSYVAQDHIPFVDSFH